MPTRRTVLIHVTGQDRPGITAGLLEILARQEATIVAMEQFVVMGRLTLDVLMAVDEERATFRDLLFFGWEREIDIEFEEVEKPAADLRLQRHAVTVLTPRSTSAALHAVTDAIGAAGGNIERIRMLSSEPVAGYEFIVAGADDASLRRLVGIAAADQGVDVAVQHESLERRAKRLVVMDVDSTLIKDEVIDLLAEEAGRREDSERITAAAMAGELDFAAALTERVRLLAGLDAGMFERVRAKLRLTPGARRFVATLHRLGYATAIVSGGFTPFTDALKEQLAIDHAYANELEVVDGRLTGRLVGPIVDRARKARVLEEIAAMEGIPLEQTVAIGDGANDVDMLARAGLGIAFNAKAQVARAADTTVSVPYLDAILFLLGIGAEDIAV